MLLFLVDVQRWWQKLCCGGWDFLYLIFTKSSTKGARYPRGVWGENFVYFLHFGGQFLLEHSAKSNDLSGEGCVTVANKLTHTKLRGWGTSLLIFGKVPRSSQHGSEEGYSVFCSRAACCEFLLKFAVDFSEKIHKSFQLNFLEGAMPQTYFFGGWLPPAPPCFAATDVYFGCDWILIQIFYAHDSLIEILTHVTNIAGITPATFKFVNYWLFVDQRGLDFLMREIYSNFLRREDWG